MSVLGRTRDAIALAVVSLLFVFALAGTAWALPDFDADGFVPPQDCNNVDAGIAPGKPDEPDLGFEDSNCDGVDGTIAKAVFVSRSTGDDAFSGSKDFPKRTINAAIPVAKAAGKDVFVTAGPYSEMLNLDDGVDIYGGYVPVTFQRSTAEATVITGSPQAALADGDQGVVLQLLTLSGVAPGFVGQSAYGLRAINGSSVALRNVTSRAGNAMVGAGGFTSSRPGTPARPAQAVCGTGDASRGPRGTGGGNLGGLGGGGGFGNASGFTGTIGLGPNAGGAGSVGTVNTNGGNGGTAFFPSAAGGNGGNATFNLLNAAAGWVGNDNSTDGANGAPGSGGGGGGGSGGSFISLGTDLSGPGAGGGGGGAGGLAGIRGTRGRSGGGSFGAYLFNATLVATQSTLSGGNGGAGGNGGEGTLGGPGGPGGFGADFCGFFANLSGGDGGAGSTGGTAGDGGGGAGGPSAGVFRTGAGAVYTSRSSTHTTGAAGIGGRRGTSPVAPRANPGQSQAIMSAPSAIGTTADFDGDGRTDAGDTCPELAAPAGDADGCPARPAKLADADGDQIPDGSDGCAGTPRGPTDLDENGCPDTPPVVVPTGRDADADGFFAGQDCDDNNGNIRPGAQEVLGNTTDENCDGTAAPFPNITSALGNNWSVLGKKVRMTEMRARRVPAGAKGRISCKGKKCPFKKKNVKAKRGNIDFLKALTKKQRKFRAGQTIEVRITARNFIGKVVRFKLKARKIPKGQTLCLPVGASRPQRCT